MNWRLVQLADAVPRPWRNGGGVTRELLAWPQADDWIWRMSVAEVAHSGPFSRFEGVQRWFAVLGGAGVRLSVGGETHAL
ncbi:MAG: HutD family protein, partial [Rhodoferax sp.]|nr:HutD family protein [Rhodoferax sp.]